MKKKKILISLLVNFSKYILRKYDRTDVDKISLDVGEALVNTRLTEMFVDEMFNFFKKS
jgi:hypothetical protein